MPSRSDSQIPPEGLLPQHVTHDELRDGAVRLPPQKVVCESFRFRELTSLDSVGRKGPRHVHVIRIERQRAVAGGQGSIQHCRVAAAEVPLRVVARDSECQAGA